MDTTKNSARRRRFGRGLAFALVAFTSAAPALSQAVADTAQRRPPADTLPITASSQITEYAEAYYQVQELNAGLPEAQSEPNLQSPQAALEYFVRAMRADRANNAARALNLNLTPAEHQAAWGPVLAERLFYVLDRQLGFDWEGLPDRADGQRDQPTSPNDPGAGSPQRSVPLGTLDADGRDIAIRLQRVKPADEPPVWVFSPQTVENIPRLYQRFGPGPIERRVPDWAQVQILGQNALWKWIALLGTILVALLLAYGVRYLLRRRFAASGEGWIRRSAGVLATPLAALIGLAMVYGVASFVLSLSGAVTITLLVLVIAAVTWLAMRVIDAAAEQLAARHMEDLKTLSGDRQSQQQRWLTYLSVGHRVIGFVLFLLGLGIILSQFQSLQTLGISLIASAGVASVILGIAAQPVLGNVIAGLQIAVSRPVRIGDSVVYEGNWGYVEDITQTFVLIQTWDKRRLVVPLRHLVTHPFENWTIRDAHLVKPIYLYANFSVDVDRIREKFEELIRASDEWDGESEPTVQVTSITEDTLEIRALCGAENPISAWALHCRVREEMAKFLGQLDDGRHLPSRRIALTEEGDAASHPFRSGASYA